MAYKDKQRQMEYQREHQAKWYLKHRERLLAKRRQHYRELRQWLGEYKSTLQCKECGISHPAVLQFHHRDRTEKSFNIADVSRNAGGIKQLMDEVKKCDVLCVNCHAKLHWREKYGTDSWLEVLPEEE
jgi:hypothetical protein